MHRTLVLLGSGCWAVAAAYAADTDWPAYNHTASGERFSGLSKINTRNVSRLKAVCTYDTGHKTSFQSGLIEVNDVLYGTSEDDTFAIDPATCRELWRVHEDSHPAP